MRGQRNRELILLWFIDFQICVRIQENMLQRKRLCMYPCMSTYSSELFFMYSFFSFESIQLRYTVM